MKTLTRNTKIASLFMLAEKYEDHTTPAVGITMPKLNGLRAMYIPGSGFWSRDGVQYSPACTDHIKLSPTKPIDGEFYLHGLDLQEINSLIGVNLDQPTEKTATIQFHAFDIVDTSMRAHMRMNRLGDQLVSTTNVVQIDWKLSIRENYINFFTDYIRRGYEGQMLKDAYSVYTPGRTSKILKNKRWYWIEARITKINEGLGELTGMFGGATVVGPAGEVFNVGGGKGLTHDERARLWVERSELVGKTVKVRYLSKSTDGIPLNATIVL